jgi:3-oxoacyl-[acyl-carrier-protein] synthase-1
MLDPNRSGRVLALGGVGMVTSVGLNAAATCAAIRAGVRNMSETSFVGASAEPLMAAQVSLPRPWRGRTKLVKMLSAAIRDCVSDLPEEDREGLPLLVGMAEHDRPGRLESLDETFVEEVESETKLRFSPRATGVVALGRVSGLVALERVRTLLLNDGFARVLVAGVDSLLVRTSLSALLDEDRLLTSENSNGFIPGEAAACVSVEPASTNSPTVACVGMGVAEEQVTIRSGEPFRAEGLTRAIVSALADAGIDLAACGLRLTDLSGEHYYFRETALALSRILRREGARELWHPAECVGEVGAAIGPILLGYAAIAARKDYLPGPHVLVHASADGGLRAAACLAVGGRHGE